VLAFANTTSYVANFDDTLFEGWARTANGVHVLHFAGRVIGPDINPYDNLVWIAPVIGRGATAKPPAHRNHLVVDVPCGVASRADHANAVEPKARPNPEADNVPAGLAAIDGAGVANRTLVLIDADGNVAWTYESPSPGEFPGPDIVREALAA